MYKIVIFIVFIAVGSTIHASHPIDHHFNAPINHMQSTVKNPAFDGSFNDIQALVDGVNTALKSKDSNKYQFLITKTSEIKAGLNKLQSTLLSYNLTITNTSRLCPGITTFNRTELRRYITYTQQKEYASVQYTSTCIDCSFVTSDLLKIQNLTYSLVQNLNKTLDGDYCPKNKAKSQKVKGYVNLNNSYFKNNLNAKNWYYGSTTASDYKIYIFKRSSTYNLTNCPLETPFVKDQEQVCFDCPEGSIFNLGQQNCDTCKAREILNVRSGKCDECYGQKKFINGSLVCKLCKITEGQLLNETSAKCYSCKSDSYLDTDKLACIKIDCDPSTPRFNKITHQCEPCGVSEVIDPHNITRCIKTNYIALCPPTTPLYDEKMKQCVACPANTQYNKGNNKCESSPAGNHFIQTHHTSVGRHAYEAAQSISVCPSDKPRYNYLSTKCEACSQGQIYYKDSGNCEKDVKCGPTQTVNRTTYTCVQTSSTCKTNQVYAIKINRCLPKSMTCSQYQFYDSQLEACISMQSDCNRDQYYNKNTRNCALKQAKCKANEQYNYQYHICQKLILCKGDEEFNFQLRICQKKSLKCNQETEYFDNYQLKCARYSFITSPLSANLILRGDYEDYLNLYQNSKKSTPHLKDCPVKTPYYKKSTGSCILCPSSALYFDIQQDQCIQCPEKQLYNPSNHRCQTINLTSVSNTIGRIQV